MKPIVGITMGDPAGIGPEVVLKALARPEIYQMARPIVIGDLSIMKRDSRLLGLDVGVEPIDECGAGQNSGPARSKYFRPVMSI